MAAKRSFSYKGVLYKNHLAKGIAKGAFDQEAADAKFEKWQAEKQAKIANKISQRAQESKSVMKKRLEAEAKIKEDREQALAAKQAKLNEKEAVAETEEGTTEETPAQEEGETPVAEA